MDTKRFLATLFLLTIVLPVHGNSPELAPGHPQQYVVQKGDTLWDIASHFLRDPWRWPDIWDRNPHIDNPHLIYPGDFLSLVYADGKPVIQIQRGGVMGEGVERRERPATTRTVPSRAALGRSTVQYGPQVRVVEREEAIPTIPLDAISQFLNASRVVSEYELELAPYIVSLGKEHLMGARLQTAYARGLDGGDIGRYAIYRPGKAYRNPGQYRDGMYTGEGDILGYEALYVGDAVLERTGDPATVYVTKTSREVLKGDRLLPAREEGLSANFMPHPFDKRKRGHIVAVLDGVTQIGRGQVVVLNLGSRDGIDVGHVLAVYQTGVMVQDEVYYKNSPQRRPAVPDDAEAGFPYTLDRDIDQAGYNIMDLFVPPRELIELPPERAGVVMVFRPFERASYALVMEATRAMHLYDSVTSP